MPTDEVEFVEWREAPARPVLCKDRVHLWRVDLDGFRPASESAWDVLSDDESARAHHFRFERDRDRVLIRRAFLRSILGSYLDADPRRLEFDYGEMQKPTLAVPSESGDLRFNQSESGGLAIYAFTLGREVGVDVREVDVDRLGSVPGNLVRPACVRPASVSRRPTLESVAPAHRPDADRRRRWSCA